MRKNQSRGSRARDRRSLAVVAATGVLLLGLVSPASATTVRIRLSRTSGPPTTVVTVHGEGFEPAEVVDLGLDRSPRGKATADGSGLISARITVPASVLPGSHMVRARGETSGLRARTPFTVRTDWTMFKFGPDHVGVNPYENVLSPETVAGLEVDWTFPAPRFFNSNPAVAGGRVFVGAGDTLYAVDASTGAMLWFRTEAHAANIRGPAVWKGRVFYGSDLGVVRAVDALTGEEAWSYATGGSTSSITLVNGVVYVGSLNSATFALDARTGGKLWSAPMGPVFAAPAVADGVVYAADWDHKLHALDTATGAELWTGGLGLFTESSPAVAGGLVYVGSDDNVLYAYPAAGCGQLTCSPVWTATTGSWVQSSPSVAYGMVFVGSDDHNIYAFDAATGALKWTVPTGDQVTLASPAVANGVVYIGSNDGVIRALDPFTGDLLWSYATGDLAIYGPVVVDGRVYVGSFESTFYAFHLPG